MVMILLSCVTGFSNSALKSRSCFRKLTSSSLASTSNVKSGSIATGDMQAMAEEEMKKLEGFYKKASFPSPTLWKSHSEASSFVHENIDTVLFDCDGVLYRTLDICPGASKCIQALLEKGKRVLFVTNNGGINRRQLKEKLGMLLGIDSFTNDQMVSSSYACSKYLKQHLSAGSRVHVIGSAGLCEELANNGFEISGGPSNDIPSMDRQELELYDFAEHPIDAIAVGHDIEFTFRKLCIANNLLLRNSNALFVATNEDSFDLVGSDTRHIPGNGCIVKALEYCSRRRAVNVGKPSNTLAKLIEEEHGLDPARSLFVGDRLDTDIRFGNDNGMKSLLVMTGVTTAQTMIDLREGTTEEPLPHFVLPHIGMLT